jgi:hypothetical protein
VSLRRWWGVYAPSSAVARAVSVHVDAGVRARGTALQLPIVGAARRRACVTLPSPLVSTLLPPPLRCASAAPVLRPVRRSSNESIEEDLAMAALCIRETERHLSFHISNVILPSQPVVRIENSGEEANAAKSDPAVVTVSAVLSPNFDHLRWEGSVEKLAGEAPVPPIMRPLDFTLVQDSVDSFNDVSCVLRHTVHLCTLLANQRAYVKNTFMLRVSLVQHVFTHVIPLPLPHNHPDKLTKCFWSSNEKNMRYETQVDILRLLEMVARHFSAASLSLRITRSFDAARVITMACMVRRVSRRMSPYVVVARDADRFSQGRA